MRALRAAGVALALAVIVGAAPVTLGRLTASQTATASATTGTLAPPTSLAASASGATVTLTWTPTVTLAATGYDVLRSITAGSGYAVVASVTPRTAATTTNAPGTGTFYYVLQSSVQNWRSANSNEASVTVGTLSTGLKPCLAASNAADTGGNGNGYETTPGNACAVDGATAVDAGSGTNTVLSCTDAGKDRHRFWGYAFGLPGTVTSINGITVQVDAGLNNNGGTTQLCVQLSWDGGTSWTTAKSFVFGGAALATYTLGAANDSWGRAWTPAQFATTAFRVRVIDVTNQPSKDFRLDGLQVAVAYSP